MGGALIPQPAVPMRVRPGTMDDIDFMDALQKRHGHALGWFPRKQFEGYVEMGGVLIAESVHDEARPSGSATPAGRVDEERGTSPVAIALPHGRASLREPLGYILSKDRYSGRDDVGAIYQLAVDPTAQRKCVGAALVKAVFEQAAYGCRLFCCWCAQDLAANRFWESVGFVPIAYRTGSRGKGRTKQPRTHILWQRRVRAEDEGGGGGGCPYWYPFQTKNGAVREERLVFPIAPGVHWSEAKPVILPEEAQKPAALIETEQLMLAASAAEKRARRRKAKPIVAQASEPRKIQITIGGKTKWISAPDDAMQSAATAPLPCEATPLQLCSDTAPTTPTTPKPMLKHERAAIAFCRELRDRWQERVAEEPEMLLPGGKYDVARSLEGSASLALPAQRTKALPLAA